MDSIESIDENFTGGEMKVNAESLEHLRLTARWGQFLSILGFIGLGLMVLGIFGMLAMSQTRYGGGFDSSIVILIYFVMVIVYFFPTYYLYQFSAKTKRAIEAKDTMTFAEATGLLKNLFQYLGVFAIIVVSIYILVILAAIGGALT